MNNRKELLECIRPIINECIEKAQNGRFQSKENARIRIQYINALSRLLAVYNQINKDIELEELSERLDELERREWVKKKRVKDRINKLKESKNPSNIKTWLKVFPDLTEEEKEELDGKTVDCFIDDDMVSDIIDGKYDDYFKEACKNNDGWTY